MADNPCIIITRPYEDSKRTAHILKESGFDSFCEPAIIIEHTPTTKQIIIHKLNEKQYDGIIVTSLNAIRALADFNIPEIYNLKILVLGEETLTTASNKGFKHIELIGKNISEAKEYIKSHYKNHAFIYASGELITEELTQSNCSAAVERLIIYKTIPTTNLSENFKEGLIAGKFSGILFFSQNSAKIFIKLLQKEKLEIYLKNLYAFCLSKEIAGSISNYGFKATLHAKNPNMETIINLLINFRF